MSPSILIAGRKTAPALKVLGVIAFYALTSSIHAQYRLDTWTTDNGLPQNSVTGLTQTPDGYLWLTTNDGLVRFDGYRFKIFNKGNTPQLTTNRLSAAFADVSGRMWFQAEDGGILYYEKGVFTVAARPNEIPPGPRSQFFDDPAGGVILNINHQPYRYEAGRFVPFDHVGLRAGGRIILADRQGGLWFSGNDELRSFKNGVLKTYPLGGIFNGRVYQVAYEDRQGNLWVGFFADSKQSLVRLKDGRAQEVRLPDDAVNHFAEDAQGNLWLSIYTQGIYRIDREAADADVVPADAVKSVIDIDGISRLASGHLNFDREGGLWVGTEKSLNRIAPRVMQTLSRKEGLEQDNVYPIISDSAGRVWAGVWPNNLARYENGRFKTILISNETVFITSFFEDASGRLWFGNIGNLSYLQGERPVDFTGRAGFAKGTEFSAITQTGDGALWFGTNVGLGRYAGGRASVYTTGDGLPDNNVVALLPSKGGRLWVGTRGGLASFEDGRFRSFTAADGLASDHVRCLFEDAEGALWVGSYDGGLTRIKDGKFNVYTMRDGLSSNGVFCILEDANGWFWINSNQGIYRVSRRELDDFAEGKLKSLNSISYNRQDGLLNIEGNGGRQPAGTKTADGRLWFPTAEGVAVVDPGSVFINRLPPPVLIEEVLIDRVPVTNEIFQPAVTHQSDITLGPGQTNLEISYTALSYVNSGQLKFKYKLENLDEDWNDVGTRRAAYYAHLPPGEYTFRVIAANRDGVWNEQGASLKVRIRPPFYRTWWFMLLACVLCAAFVLLGFYVRLRQLKAKSTQQEEFARQLIDSQELERGRIAAELHDGLSQSLAIIKNRAMLSLSRPEDRDHALEQLREISDASSEAIDEVKEIIYDLRPIQLDRLGLTGAIEDIAEKVAGVNDFRLFKEVEDVDNVLPKPWENSVYRIVQETLNNVVKHSQAGEVSVRVSRGRSEVSIVIKDDGVGFEPNAPGVSRGRIGFGLLGMSERAKLLGGRTTVESAQGAGTKVTVVLPLKTDKAGMSPDGAGR